MSLRSTSKSYIEAGIFFKIIEDTIIANDDAVCKLANFLFDIPAVTKNNIISDFITNNHLAIYILFERLRLFDSSIMNPLLPTPNCNVSIFKNSLTCDFLGGRRFHFTISDDLDLIEAAFTNFGQRPPSILNKGTFDLVKFDDLLIGGSPKSTLIAQFSKDTAIN